MFEQSRTASLRETSSVSASPLVVNHDDEVFELLLRMLTAPVISILTDDPDPVYELQVEISADEICQLAEKLKRSFLEQPTLLVLGEEPCHVVADLHGQAIHLLRIFSSIGQPPAQKYLFLGDYVDRGSQSITVMCLLWCLKHRYPQHVYLLRGNHEDINTTLNYGFYDECLDVFKSNRELGEQVWRVFIDTFNCMPLAATIGGRVFCAHGGISPWMDSAKDVNSIERPLVVPPFGLACDLVWSDPAPPERNGWSLSHRGISFTYGQSVVDEFCMRNDISLVIRGHQLSKEMYPSGCVLRFGGRLISLFSALNYESHRNNCCVLRLEFGQRVTVKQLLFRCRHYAPLRNNEYLGYRDMKAMSKKDRKKWNIDNLLNRM